MGRRRDRAAAQGGPGRRNKKLIDALIWQLDWGDTIGAITASAVKAGIPLGTLPCVASRVDPLDHLTFEAEAYRELATDRSVGFDRGPIPWRSIHLYAERYGLVKDDFDRFAEIIRAMDRAFLSYKKSAPES